MNETQKDTPKKLNLLWFNLLAVVPFAVLLVKALSTHDFRYGFWALIIAPVALVTLGLDVYQLVKRVTSK